MGTATTTVVASLNVAVTPASVDVQPGQKVEFTNHSKKFPKFAIVFVGPSPASPTDILTGTNKVEINVVEAGDFTYKIRHSTESGDASVDTGAFSIRSCPGGCG
jgi:plastocyanin